MLPSFASDTIVRVRAVTVEDDHGDLSRDWATSDRVTISGCLVQPGASQEILDNRESVSIAWTVYAPYGSDVVSTDRVEFEGVTYPVSGEPLRWRSPSGQLSHVVIALERWAEHG